MRWLLRAEGLLVLLAALLAYARYGNGWGVLLAMAASSPLALSIALI